MKGFIIDGDYLLPVKVYMERMNLPRPRLRRPRLKIPIITIEVSIWE